MGGNHESVADHTIALMLSVGHRFRETQANMIGGNWSILLGNDLYRKTVGVIGLGRIGKSLVKRLSGFEAEVLAYSDVHDEAYAAETGVEYVSLDTLLSRSDYATVHAPLTPQTRFIIDEAALGRMKPTAFLINARARRPGRRRGAAGGPARRGDRRAPGWTSISSESDAALKPVTQALIELPNVIATPHSAASSREGLDRTNRVAAQCVVAVLDGDDPAPECVVADGR